jgi:hypothetical protein
MVIINLIILLLGHMCVYSVILIVQLVSSIRHIVIIAAPIIFYIKTIVVKYVLVSISQIITHGHVFHVLFTA